MESLILGFDENSFPHFKMIWKSKVPLKEKRKRQPNPRWMNSEHEKESTTEGNE